MWEPYKAFHESYNGQCSLEMALKEQHIEFEMLSNSKKTPIATTLIIVKNIQGVLCSHIMKILFDYGKSASMISRNILPKED